MTGTGPRRSARPWLWVAVPIALVLLLPLAGRAATWARGRTSRSSSAASAIQLAVPSVTPAQGYPVRFGVSVYMRVPWGARPGRVARWGIEERVAQASATEFGVTREGDVWVFDHPPNMGAGPRIQRFDSRGQVRVSEIVEPGASLMNVAPDGSVFYDLSRGMGEQETVVRRDRSGHKKVEYVVPPGVYLTSVEVSPDGAVFGRSEAWRGDPAAGNAFLFPQLAYLGNVQAARPGRTIDGYTFSPIGELVQVEWTLRRSDIEVSERTIRFKVPSGKDARVYSAGGQSEFVGVDAAGHIYLELGFRADAVASVQRLNGHVDDRYRRIAVFDRAGRHLATAVVPRDGEASTVGTAVRVSPDGRIYVAGGDARGFVVYVARVQAAGR